MQRISQILIQQLNFILPNGKSLFDKLSLTFAKNKTGLIGKNGIGKSTLIKLIAGEFAPHSGSIHLEGTIAYLPQNPVIDSTQSVAELLGFSAKLNALHRIAAGSIDERDFAMLDEDWNVEERLQQQLQSFGLQNIPYTRPLNLLSGGELTRLLLIKIFLSDADFLLLDEPTNHLDSTARQQLYEAIKKWSAGLIVISHDRALLNLMDEIIELTTLGASVYGGNYEFYVEQKSIEQAARELQLHDAKKIMQKSKQTVQLSREKHEQKQSYGRKLRKSGSIDKMGANAKKGRSERTQSKLLIKEERLLKHAENEFTEARKNIEIIDEIHLDLPATQVPKGKMILEIEDLSFSYSRASQPIIDNFNLKMQGPERIALSGANGSGKTTLINLILGVLTPTTGKIMVGTQYVSYLDQNASLLNPYVSVLNNFLLLNPQSNEQDAYFALAQFLFKNVTAEKLVKDLSGGEKLRALLACVLLATHPPQLLILDEPTNHLDLASIKSIESALQNYQGAMIVISHDQMFLENVGVERVIEAAEWRHNM